jgi:hypothetical protein
MSAMAANVSSGEINAITPAITKSAPKIQWIHCIAPPASVPNTRLCAPAARNMIPMITPTVVTEA